MDRFAPILPRQLGIGPAAQPALAPLPHPAKADPAGAAGSADPAAAHYRAKATEAAVKFESFFIGDMLDMADNLVADQMAGQRAFGVADAILRQLLPQGAPVAPHQPGVPMPLAPATNNAKTI